MMQEMEEQKSARGVEEYWAVVRRRKWWIIGPLFIGWLLVFVSAWIIPAQYTSESVILIDKSKVPETFVRSNVNVEMGERLESITQQVLSRSAAARHHQPLPPVSERPDAHSGRPAQEDAQRHQDRSGADTHAGPIRQARTDRLQAAVHRR